MQIRKQDTGGQVKRALAFHAAGQPAEPPLLAGRSGSLTSVEETIRVVAQIHFRGNAKLAEIAPARGALRGQPAFRQNRHQHRREHRDDGDDDEQFDEREGALASSQPTRGGSDSKSQIANRKS